MEFGAMILRNEKETELTFEEMDNNFLNASITPFNKDVVITQPLEGAIYKNVFKTYIPDIATGMRLDIEVKTSDGYVGGYVLVVNNSIEAPNIFVLEDRSAGKLKYSFDGNGFLNIDYLTMGSVEVAGFVRTIFTSANIPQRTPQAPQG